MNPENKKRVIKEVAGTIIDVYEEGIIIQPDDENESAISESFEDRDYSKFKVGQRVLCTYYTWLRKATEKDKQKYKKFKKQCPEFVSEGNHVTEDEEAARLRKEAEEASKTTTQETNLEK